MEFRVLLIAAIVVYIVRQIYLCWRGLSLFPTTIPWVGAQKHLWSRLMACLRQVPSSTDDLKAGYTLYSAKARSFVLPDFGLRPQALIPPELIRWFSEQPDAVLDAHNPIRESVGLHYLVPTLDTVHNNYIVDVVRKDTTRNLGELQPEIISDLMEAVDRSLGTDTDKWKEIHLYKTMQEILFNTSNRMFVGQPLCKNKTFLRSSAMFSDLLGIGAVFVGEMLPQLVKPIFGYLLALPIFLAQSLAFHYLVPEIKYRVNQMRRKQSDTSYYWQQPKDLLMWVVNAAIEQGGAKADNPQKMAQALLFLMLGGIHTSIVTATNVFLDLLSSPAELHFYAKLREEAESVFAQSEDWEKYSSLAKLVRTDSTIRESLRMNPVITKTGIREVTKSGGIVIPNGDFFPQGAWVSVPALGVHYDERFYVNAKQFKPFRFVEPSTLEAALPPNITSVNAKSSERTKKHLSQGLSTATDKFLGFGYGRHSCPGRWFVALQLKLLIAYIVLRYDFEHLPHRPVNYSIGQHLFPSQSYKVRVRRRKVS